MDLSKATSAFDLVPDGDYPAYIFEVKQDVTKGGKAPGTPMLKVTYKLNDTSNRRVFDNIVLNEASAWKFKQLCIAAGISDDRLGADAAIELSELQGQPVVITVGHQDETQQFPARNTVAKVQNPELATTVAPSTGNGW